MADFSSYTNVLNSLREQQRASQGYITDTSSLGGSEAANLAARAGAMEQQRTIDPWSFYRGGAADELAGMVGEGSPSEFYSGMLKNMMSGEFDTTDPSYQWRFDQGQQAVERSLAAKGLLNSGNAAIELQTYGQGMASQEYQAQFERLLAAMDSTESAYNKNFGRLAELAGIGNVGANLGKQQLDQGIADNSNEQAGIARAMRRYGGNGGFNPTFGSSAIG